METAMNFQWMGQSGPCPIVEFHDVRTEAGGADTYLDLAESRLTGPLVAAGGADLARFSVRGHADRVMLMRSYAGMTERRRSFLALHGETDWPRHRQAAADLVRSESVMLMRAITPAAGIRPVHPGTGVAVLISELRFAEQIGNYHLWLRLLLRKAGLDPLAAFATLEAVNDVPAVPVVRNRTQHVALLPQRDGRSPELPPELRDMLRFPPELLTLDPAPALVW
jgi:hypothetical protein